MSERELVEVVRRVGALAGVELRWAPDGDDGGPAANGDGMRLRGGPVLVESASIGREPSEGDVSGALTLASDVVSLISSLEREIDSLTDEVLERYEEITLLHELARELVAVFDERDVCSTVVRRTLQAVPATMGSVFLFDLTSQLTETCSQGDDVDASGPFAFDVAVRVCTQGSILMVHQDELWDGAPVPVPVLAVPLLTTGSEGSAPLGALVLLGRAGGRFTSSDASLTSTIAQQLARTVENDRLVTSLREKERMERDMELAGDIQRQLLPPGGLRAVGVAVAAACIPAERVGGDYFDFLEVDGCVTALVADVSGHGVGPGLMMAMTRTVLRRELQDGVSLIDALQATNRLMWDDLDATGLFITLFCVRYDARRGTMSYVNGGHHPGLLRRAAGVIQRLDGDGWPLGLIRDPHFEELTVPMAAGDAVVLYTDGITEERSPSGEMFGTERLVAVVGSDGGPLVGPVLAAAAAWRAGGPQQDDVTCLELRIVEGVTP